MNNYFQNYLKAVNDPLPELRQAFLEEKEYILQHVSPETTVLDVGCGNGRVEEYLAPNVRKIVGVDNDPLMIKEATRLIGGLPNVEIVEQDIFTYSTQQKFDLVLAVYNFLGSPEVDTNNALENLQKLFAHVKKQGHLLLTVWDSSNHEFIRTYYPSIGIDIKEVGQQYSNTSIGKILRFSKEELATLVSTLKKPFSIHSLNNIFFLTDITNS